MAGAKNDRIALLSAGVLLGVERLNLMLLLELFSCCDIVSSVVWSVRVSRDCADDLPAIVSVLTVGFIGNPVVVATVPCVPETLEPSELIRWRRPLQTIFPLGSVLYAVITE